MHCTDFEFCTDLLPWRPYITRDWRNQSRCNFTPYINIGSLRTHNIMFGGVGSDAKKYKIKFKTRAMKNNKKTKAETEAEIKKEKTILAIDIGIKTGWAIKAADGIIYSGREDFKIGKFEGRGMLFLKFRRWLVEIKNQYPDLSCVYFEEVRRHLGTDAAHAYGGFAAQVMAFCEHHEISYAGVPVQTIKKHISSKGNASKAEVIQAVKAKGFAPACDNEADALALLDLVLERLGREELWL